MSFQKATKARAFLRAALYAVSGGGKTYSALAIATGLGGKIAVIDSERGSASKYADRFDFDVCELGADRTIEAYVKAIGDAASAGYGVLIIDSLSHAWQELLEEIDRLANTKHRGNTWAAWRDGTPKQRKLVDAILSYPGHVIATMRAKTEWESSKGDNGKIQPKKVGLAPEQGKGIEYEFDVLMSISAEHVAYVEKDRTGKFQDATIDKPGEDFGKKLAAWLNSGAEPKKPEAPKPAGVSIETKRAIGAELRRVGVTEDRAAYVVALNDGAEPETEAEAQAVLTKLKKQPDAASAEPLSV